jgi:hypothetical protein
LCTLRCAFCSMSVLSCVCCYPAVCSLFLVDCSLWLATCELLWLLSFHVQWLLLWASFLTLVTICLVLVSRLVSILSTRDDLIIRADVATNQLALLKISNHQHIHTVINTWVTKRNFIAQIKKKCRTTRNFHMEEDSPPKKAFWSQRTRKSTTLDREMQKRVCVFFLICVEKKEEFNVWLRQSIPCTTKHRWIAILYQNVIVSLLQNAKNNKNWRLFLSAPLSWELFNSTTSTQPSNEFERWDSLSAHLRHTNTRAGTFNNYQNAFSSLMRWVTTPVTVFKYRVEFRIRNHFQRNDCWHKQTTTLTRSSGITNDPKCFFFLSR